MRGRFSAQHESDFLQPRRTGRSGRRLADVGRPRGADRASSQRRHSLARRGPLRMSYFRPHVEALQGYIPGEQPQSAEIIKLNTNENPYPPSDAVVAAIDRTARDSLARYPEATATAFRMRARRAARRRARLDSLWKRKRRTADDSNAGFRGRRTSPPASLSELRAIQDVGRYPGSPGRRNPLRARLVAAGPLCRANSRPSARIPPEP